MPELTDLSYVRALCEKYDFALPTIAELRTECDIFAACPPRSWMPAV